MKKKLVLVGIVGWSLALGVGYVLAQEAPGGTADIPVINVTGEKTQVPIAIPAFQALGGSGDPQGFASSLRKTLAYDIGTSSFFRALDPKSYIAKAGEGIEAATINFGDWFQVGAQLLAKTGFSLSGSNLRLEGRLYEIGQQAGKLVLSKDFSGDAADARRLTHQWANAIVKYFTNEDGIFNTRIAYTRQARIGGEMAKNLYLIDYDGSGKRALTSNKGLNILPRWAPGGAALLASSTVNRKWQVVRVATGSGKMKVLASQRGLNLGGGYSPDGNSFVATLSQDGNSEIYLFSASGELLRRLTDHWGIDSSPTFAPDGARIAFVSDRSGSPQIYVMGTDGSGQRRLTFRGSYNQEPDWSPKGDKIVFSGRDAKFDIFTATADNGSIERLTQGQGNNEHAKWSPDGRQLVFSSTRGGGSSLWMMMADGTNPRAMSGAGKGTYTPAWSPRL